MMLMDFKAQFKFYISHQIFTDRFNAILLIVPPNTCQSTSDYSAVCLKLGFFEMKESMLKKAN